MLTTVHLHMCDMPVERSGAITSRSPSLHMLLAGKTFLMAILDLPFSISPVVTGLMLVRVTSCPGTFQPKALMLLSSSSSCPQSITWASVPCFENWWRHGMAILMPLMQRPNMADATCRCCCTGEMAGLRRPSGRWASMSSSPFQVGGLDLLERSSRGSPHDGSGSSRGGGGISSDWTCKACSLLLRLWCHSSAEVKEV